MCLARDVTGQQFSETLESAMRPHMGCARAPRECVARLALAPASDWQMPGAGAAVLAWGLPPNTRLNSC